MAEQRVVVAVVVVVEGECQEGSRDEGDRPMRMRLWAAKQGRMRSAILTDAVNFFFLHESGML